VPFGELVSIVEGYCDKPLVVTGNADAAEIDVDPEDSLGKDAASDIAAAVSDLGWTPRPFADQVQSYLDWACGQLRAGVN
jgi:hypothetical protein